MSLGRPVWNLLIVGLGTLVVPLDSAVNVAFPAIVERFGLDIPAIQWLVISYVLTHAALMLACGRLGDLFGHRRIFLIGAATSAAAFAACTLAPGYLWLLAARMLQGAGAALILSCGPALATSLFPETRRARVLGLYTMMFSIGGAIGPVLAGALLARFGWSGVFAFRIPIALLALVCGLLLPRSRPSPGSGAFDGRGAVLLVVALSAGLLGLQRLRGLPETWPAALALAALSVLAGHFFLRRQRSAAAPLLAPHHFRNAWFRRINAANMLGTLAGFSVLLLVPFFLARATTLSVGAAGLLLAVAPAGTALASPLAGWLAGPLGPRRLAVFGLLAAAAGLLGIGTAGMPASIAWLAAAMLVQGAGFGLFQVAYFDIVTATLPRSERGIAGSLGMLTRTVGMVSGATLLMLLLHLMGGDADFPAAFSRTVLVAACIPLVAAIALWQR